MRFRDAWLCVVLLAWPSALRADDWKYDVIYLKNGHSFDGLVTAETKDSVHFKCISRRPGSRSSVFTTVFQREEIARIDRAGEQDRQELAHRLEQLEGREDKEKARMAALPLEKVAWPN